MLDDFHSNQSDFEIWQQSPLGEQVAKSTQAMLQEHLAESFGIYQVHIGPGASQGVACESALLRKITMGRDCNGVADIVMDPHQIPVASDSLQVLVAHHLLDFSSHPHDILREAARVVMPGGRFIVIGFNPMSSWGLMRRMPFMQPKVPFCYSFLAQHRLNDWLRLLNFKPVKQTCGFYRLPINNDKWLCRTDNMERFIPKLCRAFGAIYVVSAVRQECRINIHQRAWRVPLAPAKTQRPALGAARDGRSSINSYNLVPCTVYQ